MSPRWHRIAQALALGLTVCACAAGRTDAQAPHPSTRDGSTPRRGAGPLVKSAPPAKEAASGPVQLTAHSSSEPPVARDDSAEALPLPARRREGEGRRGSETGPGWGSSLGALIVVVGLGLGAVWMLKRVQPAGNERLPPEAVESLGRTTLPGGQHLHLVRCGGKLLLLAVGAHGARTLSEVADPDEVARLSALCRPTTKEAARG